MTTDFQRSYLITFRPRDMTAKEQSQLARLRLVSPTVGVGSWLVRWAQPSFASLRLCDLVSVSHLVVIAEDRSIAIATLTYVASIVVNTSLGVLLIGSLCCCRRLMCGTE